jgi:protein-L-isoaspartate(D-aspartate) O-methyltransferase
VSLWQNNGKVDPYKVDTKKMTDFQAAREAMVDCQVRPSDVTKYPIIDALLRTPRENFVPEAKQSIAYMGDHIAISDSRIILDPRTFAKMLDAVSIRSDEMVLDIACGTGYSTAIISHLAQVVVAIESDEALAKRAGETLAEADIDNAIVVNAALSAGAPKHGPYDVIFVEAAIQEFPETLVNQLKDGGRVVAIIGDGAMGQCQVGIKTGQKIAWRSEFDANAPLLEGFEKPEAFSFV